MIAMKKIEEEIDISIYSDEHYGDNEVNANELEVDQTLII
jgi:hypothetical protein